MRGKSWSIYGLQLAWKTELHFPLQTNMDTATENGRTAGVIVVFTEDIVSTKRAADSLLQGTGEKATMVGCIWRSFYLVSL